MASALALGVAGCSPDPTKLPFAEAVQRVTALRIEGREPVEVIDSRAVALFKEYLLKAEKVPQPGEKSVRHSDSVALRLGDKWMTSPCQFAYDDLPKENPSFVRWGGTWYEVHADFRAMVEALRRYRPNSYSVDAADLEFLRRYGWTPFFLVSTMAVDLPATLIHKPGEFPEAIYWAWNNELSKDIELDITPYLGKMVEARLYKTVKMLPESVGANRDDGKAVVVRSEGRIIGSWLSLGRHFPFACSLAGHDLEGVTEKTFDEWVVALIDPNDPLEQELAAMDPEEVLETYYTAIDRKDYVTAHACESRSYLLSYIAGNMDNDRLYNDGFGEESGKGLGNFISVKFLGANRTEEFESAEGEYGGMRCYSVSVEQYREVGAGSSDGLSGYIVYMKQEMPDTGWRIQSIGTGP